MEGRVAVPGNCDATLRRGNYLRQGNYALAREESQGRGVREAWTSPFLTSSRRTSTVSTVLDGEAAEF
eukprot:6017978-Pyramimonas_sp.AAC.1